MVGILTFHRGPNHGGYLQAYESARAVASLGHDVEIINYQNEGHHRSEKFRPWVYRRPATLWHAWCKHRAFTRALGDLPLGRFTTREEEIDWSRYHAVLIGADVVWDYSQERLGMDPLYFGGFRRRFDGCLASYAPSCGTADPEDGVPDWVKTGLEGFDKISVRDETTATLVRSATGREAPLVVDPTWLPIRHEEPVNGAAHRASAGGYLAVYAFSIDPATARAIRDYASARGLRVIASGYRHRWADEFRSSLSPLQWVEFLRDAAAVFCGTFHGALYAIRLGKRFTVLPNDRIRAKLATPMKLAGLEDRWLRDPGDLEQLMELPHDHGRTLERLGPAVERSWSFLEAATLPAGRLSPEVMMREDPAVSG